MSNKRKIFNSINSRKNSTSYSEKLKDSNTTQLFYKLKLIVHQITLDFYNSDH